MHMQIGMRSREQERTLTAAPCGSGGNVEAGEALLAPGSTVAALREAVAEAIYDAMRENDPRGRQHPWVPGGNSDKQDEARRRADRALDGVSFEARQEASDG